MTAPRAALTPKEAAARYGLSVYTIHRAIRSGALQAKQPGRIYLIPLDALETWFDNLPDA